MSNNKTEGFYPKSSLLLKQLLNSDCVLSSVFTVFLWFVFLSTNSGFLQRGAEEVSSEAAGVVTRSIGPGTRPAGLRVTAMNTHSHTNARQCLITVFCLDSVSLFV